ncbi:MAG: SWIM zinc finger domain-containing protein [Deltaproteobacteria bacterium]|nr:SWIM zinc finger domain-containing protein [Deltaproteobacteria bacterium]
MPKKKTLLDRFSDLTWNDFEKWAGGKILSRGKNYQRQGRVSDLAVTEDGRLIAWVAGSKRYATRVVMDDDGLPDSICSCPYTFDCKHGVAVVIADSMSVIVKALDRSSLDADDKLAWALDAVLEDQYGICETFAEYLHRRHPKSAWSVQANLLLGRLKKFKSGKNTDDFIRDYDRDRLSDWTIHALERAGRKNEVIRFCETEARKTGSYDRLVKRLIAVQRYKEAEQWIQEGIRATKEKLPGIAVGLRNRLLEIRTAEKNWPVVAAIQVDEFVRRPSVQAFKECRKSSGRAKAWQKVREHLLHFLKKGEPPWKQKGWPLPESGLDRPVVDRHNRFPLVKDLIDIAILEKNPNQVLRWYDQRPESRFGWHGVNEDAIATAVQAHAPDRAVAIWKNKAEQLIAQVKPSAYQDAAKYLRKAAEVMQRGKMGQAWEDYVKTLRTQHRRKRRLIEILDGMEGKPIVKKRS